MARVKINGVWLTEEAEMKEGEVRHFQNLLTKTNEWRAGVNDLSFKQLEGHEVVMLEKPFSEEEAYYALRNFSMDKALGLDGFTIIFWQFS